MSHIDETKVVMEPVQKLKEGVMIENEEFLSIVGKDNEQNIDKKETNNIDDEIVITETLQNSPISIKIENDKVLSILGKDNENSKSMSAIAVDHEENNVAGKSKNIFGFFEEENKSPKIWVQFMVGRGEGRGGGGMDYDPSRNYFVKIVLCIVLVMLVLTALFTCIIYTTPHLRAMFVKNAFLFLIPSMIVLVSVNYAIACSACARMPPCNFIMLFLTLIAMSVVCAVITAMMRTQLIMFALLATIITVFVCFLLACSSFDFTKFILYVIVIAVAFSAVVMIVGVTMLVTETRMPMLRLIILLIGTLIQVVMLVIELQMILGGRSVELSEDEYILASILVYTSVVNLFLQFVQMFDLMDELL